VRAMHDLIVQGKVLYWGTSEWSAQEIQEAWSLADRHGLHKPQMEQPKYNLFHRHRIEVEHRHLYSRIGLGTTTFSPLASGLLTGKYNDGVPEGSRLSLAGYEWLKKSALDDEGFRRIGKIKQLQPLALSLDATLAQLAIAWCLKNPHVSSVITGASRPEQVMDNLKALTVVPRMDSSVMEEIEKILENRPEVMEL
jgi:aryl-alcohol dehydrogenase-like predicted oxidoreductase